MLFNKRNKLKMDLHLLRKLKIMVKNRVWAKGQVLIVVAKMTWNSGFPGYSNFIIPGKSSDCWEKKSVWIKLNIIFFWYYNQEDDSALLRFLQCKFGKGRASGPEFFYDPKYALRLCLKEKRMRACVHIYSMMSMHEEAVALALQVEFTLIFLCAILCDSALCICYSGCSLIYC